MRRDLALLPIGLLLVLPLPSNWWVAANHHRPTRRPGICERALEKNKHSKMAKLCLNEPVFNGIQTGLQQAQKECEHQFQHRRWNCTLKGRKKLMAKDTRETAFLYAITAAHIAYTVTKSCVLDDDCKCSQRDRTTFVTPHAAQQPTQSQAEITWQQQLHLWAKPPLAAAATSGVNDSVLVSARAASAAAQEGKAFKWGDCSNHIKYGVRISRQWLSSRFRKKSKNHIRTKIMLHNYEAGRLAIQRHMKQECKCHGLSASCTFSVCFSRMPPFREIGNRLRERFDGAVKVIYANDGHISGFIEADESFKEATDEDLIYTDESPDFCVRNLRLGVQGVAGRTCNEASKGEDGCGVMCCGFKSVQRVATAVEVNEQCEFVWCCHVTCKTRNVTRVEHVCPAPVNTNRIS